MALSGCTGREGKRGRERERERWGGSATWIERKKKGGWPPSMGEEGRAEGGRVVMVMRSFCVRLLWQLQAYT